MVDWLISMVAFVVGLLVVVAFGVLALQITIALISIPIDLARRLLGFPPFKWPKWLTSLIETQPSGAANCRDNGITTWGNNFSDWGGYHWNSRDD